MSFKQSAFGKLRSILEGTKPDVRVDRDGAIREEGATHFTCARPKIWNTLARYVSECALATYRGHTTCWNIRPDLDRLTDLIST